MGTPLKNNARRVLMLGSGELGKEVVIELMRLGAEVIACDRYANAPAMQVAHRSHVLDMLDGEALRTMIKKEKPHLIVPEVEAIATDTLVQLEEEGFQIVPTARATKLTMDREGIRCLAADDLMIPTAKFTFANSYAELEKAVSKLVFPVVIKPVMSSSGKGQSLAYNKNDLQKSWDHSQSAGRSGAGRIIVEEFIEFESEITLLTVRAANGTFFCDPIGHKQSGGDYIESWQPHIMTVKQLKKSREIALCVTDNLGGYGIYGVELFLLRNGDVYFSEVSPRPHDTGMVTMATQSWSEFALHARAILGLPIQQIYRHSIGASAACKALKSIDCPTFSQIDQVFNMSDVDLRLFGKPVATEGRRMAVTLATGTNVEDALQKAITARSVLQIE